MICDSQKAVVDFLSSPENFGGVPIQQIDTHLSHVFLVGRRVYKIKCAVRYDFKAAHMVSTCRSEVRQSHNSTHCSRGSRSKHQRRRAVPCGRFKRTTTALRARNGMLERIGDFSVVMSTVGAAPDGKLNYSTGAVSVSRSSSGRSRRSSSIFWARCGSGATSAGSTIVRACFFARAVSGSSTA